MESPWIGMGDFNSVLHIEDKVRENPVTMAEITEFHQCIEQCELVELPTSGSRYTWNDRHDDSSILSKIDWVFINTDWLNSMPTFTGQYLEKGISDHCPLKLSTANTTRRAKAVFKYYNLIQIGWLLLKAQAELHNNPLDARLHAEELQQFHKFKRHRRLQEAIIQLADKHGRMQSDQEDIATIFVDYYQELLGTKGWNRTHVFQSFLKNGKTLSTTQQMQLLRPYTATEVRSAMFSIDETKSPGPDGYRSGFYKALWSIIGEGETTAVLEFLENEQLLTVNN
ncbi:uncharacterized protein LOC142167036 [Nicotiana tabacum]|uniref:Uncharacterized protein LOC142167036 n=1 Tax=Nicotiana tabacum TaxID=4097 RepID=A0AC58SE89_TOBAC